MNTLRMRMRLDHAGHPAPEWPPGISLVPFDPETHPRQARELLNACYAQGGGSVRPYREWWEELRNDPEYDPSLCLVAADCKTGRLAAFAQCWTPGFIKDIAVAPGYRRRGIGRALLLEACHAFRNRGLAHVDLKVQSDNPTGAVAFYEAMGMIIVEDLS